MKNIRIRITGYKQISKSLIDPAPQNFRKHPEAQKEALRAAFEEIGFVGACLVRKKGKRWELIDGHERYSEFDAKAKVPCLITDLTPAEARKALATFDAIGDLAEIDSDMLAALMGDIQFDAGELDELVASVLDDAGDVKGGSGGGRKHVEFDAEDQQSILTERFQILVTCESEPQQRKLLARFEKDGLACRALMT